MKSVDVQGKENWKQERYLGGIYDCRGAGYGETGQLCNNCELGLRFGSTGVTG